MGEGISLAKKKKKISSQSEREFVPFKQINYCTLNPNILSLARNIPVQHPGFTLNPLNTIHFIPLRCPLETV